MTTRTAPASRKDWRRATTLALVALACGILLGGVSAWFLGSVAIAGLSAAALTFNFHAPAAFVRLFALARVAARYGERLFGHRAALTDQVAHRVSLFSAMAAARSVRAAGWQLGDEARLADYLDDVEDIDYARLRANLPFLTTALGLTALLSGSAIIVPFSLIPILAVLLAAAVVMRPLSSAGKVALRRNRSQRRKGAERLGSAMASAIALRAGGQWETANVRAMASFCRADNENLSLRRLQSILDMIASAFGPLAGSSVVIAAWLSGDRGEVLLLPVFLAFAWLAFGETLNGASRMLVAKLRRDVALNEIGKWTDAPANPASSPDPGRAQVLVHDNLRRLSPGERVIGAQSLALRLEAGVPTILVGASGSGKTSLLKQIAGWIGDDTFLCGDVRLTAQNRRANSTLVLHDAAILDDTVRANLFADGNPDADLWCALEAVELDQRVRQAGGLDAWIRQDTLSLGEAQRLNLARGWLSSKPIVLLDEPSEHVDAEQGQRILMRMIDRLRERILVISTHRPMPWPRASVIELHT